MIKQHIYLSRYDWTVEVLYNCTAKDAGVAMSILRNIGYTIEAKAGVERVIKSNERNTGCTYSNYESRATLVVVMKASDRPEFINTWTHELIHCAVHISQALGIPCDAEHTAYIGGSLAREMHPFVAMYVCPSCYHDEDL